MNNWLTITENNVVTMIVNMSQVQRFYMFEDENYERDENKTIFEMINGNKVVINMNITELAKAMNLRIAD